MNFFLRNRRFNWPAIIKKTALVMSLGVALLSISHTATAATGASLPLTIQAESYSAMQHVKAATTSDTGGGLYVGWIDATDWLSYTTTPVNIPTSGSYKITYRVASLSGGGNFTFHEAGYSAAYDTVPVPRTGGWQAWVDVSRIVTLPAGTHAFGLTANRGGFSINWFKIESSSSTSSSAENSSTPTSSSAASTKLPVTIQAENYSAMKDVKAATTTDTGGGLYVGWIDAKDWLDFATTPVEIPVTGDYKVTYRVASLSGGGSLYLHEIGSTKVLDTAYLVRTGGWETWVDVQRIVTLTAGTHKLGITALTGGFSLNWIKFESTSSLASASSLAPIQAPAPSPASSAPASSIAASSKPASSTPASSTPASSTPASSIAASSKPASSTPASSMATSSKTNTATSSAPSAFIAGPVEISWTAPTLRENGSDLYAADIGGYQLRYKLAAASDFTYITINDPLITFYNFTRLDGNYIFQIAAFDINGRFSSFIDIVEK